MGVPTNGKMEIIIEMPSETGKINNENPSPASPQRLEDTSGNPTKGESSKMAVLSVALEHTKTIGMQAINSSVSNIGIATGNYYAQQKAERALNGIMQFAGIAMTAMVNPVLAGVNLACMAISTGAETYRQNKEREIANYQAEQYAKRLGYTRDRK